MEDNSQSTEAGGSRTLQVEFSGSGSEYFRIWIVNLLLTLLTLGLYLPFAKVRRLRYFYANTRVDGQALSFHGRPWPMFRGFVLLLALGAAYGLAGHVSPLAGLCAYLLLCAVWPALWRAGLQFRLGNTSWRGLRLGFAGDLAGCYKAVAPIYVPSIIVVVSSVLLVMNGDAQPGAAGADPAETHPLANAVLGLGSLLMLLMGPWFLAAIKRYQHGGYRYADQRARMSTPTTRFYGLALKGLALSMLPMLVAIALIGLVYSQFEPDQAQGSPIFVAGVLLAYLLYFMIAGPYFAARLQNLCWNGTHSQKLRFVSKLRVRDLTLLTIINWLLTALTLSLYRPFAAIRTARLRLEAVQLQLDGELDSWQAAPGGAHEDATGEAAGDFFGFDMGW